MSPPFYLNKEELNKCEHYRSACQRATNRPTDVNSDVCDSQVSHELVADDLHIIASVRINERPHVRKIA